MKKNKIDLKDLQVKSFVTGDKQATKGGLKADSIIDPSSTHPTPMTYCFVCDPF